MTTTLAPPRRRPPTRRAPALPDVPLWLVLGADEWLAVRVAPDEAAPIADDRRVALHGGVAALAVETLGARRDDLVAVAIDARMLRGGGPDSPLRVDLNSDGRARLALARTAGLAAAVVAAEALRRDEAGGYLEPMLRTAGDAARSQSRDAYRRA